MSALVPQVAKNIRERISARVRARHEATNELRSVFHGPPMEFLKPLYDELAQDGGIKVDIGADKSVLIPILLRSDEAAVVNPGIGQSGVCSGDHLLNLRNSPDCPRFVALIAPGDHTNLSFASASDEFGLSAINNTGNASIEDWWKDDFIQGLVDSGLARLAISNEADKEQARLMIQLAVEAADQAERHHVSRTGAWRVLSRIYSIPGNVKAGPPLSLACGFPPTEDGQFSVRDQREILNRLASHLEENSITKGLDELKDDADAEDIEALEAFGKHLHSVCDLPTRFVRAASFFYEPGQGSDVQEPPSWWTRLTLERWVELLEEERRPEGALQIECVNAVFPPFRGGHAVVQGEIKLHVAPPEGQEGEVSAVLTRLVSGKAHTAVWPLTLQGEHEHLDPALPLHKSWARYTVEAPGLKKAAIRVISLASWEPGYFVFCRNARKIGPPKRTSGKKASADFECSLSLQGSGRHYIDLYTRPGVEFDPIAEGHEDDGAQPPRQSQVAKVDDTTWGFEAEAPGECHYDLKVRRDDGEWETLRVFLTCDDVAAEGCKTEFERLIKLNRQDDEGRAMTDVQIDRNVRCADLQTWLLSKENIEHSFYPLVVSSDYASSWHPPDWKIRAKSIFSDGKFLHDPRPENADFTPPPALIEARKRVAERLRGPDESGLVEAARLGEWLATDEKFAEDLQAYLQAYLDWITADPTVAPWADTIAFCGLEQDRTTLRQEPDAIILNPLHPVRLVWQALAQKILFLAYKRNQPCPAASILDPDSTPDILSLPLQTASGTVTHQAFLSVECSSDYWGILWNGKRLDALGALADEPPFDDVFGIRIGGISSGFSLSQVRRALDDVVGMLSAKPILSVMISSASGQTNACNEGIVDWCKERLSNTEGQALAALGQRLLQILDLREEKARPEDAEISNLAEDTSNSVCWFAGDQPMFSPDLGIIAQLETSNAKEERVDVGSPLGWGALLRHRVRRQLLAGEGAFLSESRVGVARPPAGDGLADKLVMTVAKLENLTDLKPGYVFAPSVHSIQQVLSRADFAAVSSSAVDPACFLGNWLPGYLWDYDLPSYSRRSGDTNGYYLISKIKETDRDALKATLGKLPGCDQIADGEVDAMILEVARRGIPTVRGLSSGSSGASGDLGLFIASRILQDGFRAVGEPGGLLPILAESDDVLTIALLIPVDPFRGYLDDIQRVLKDPQLLRPDLLVAGIRLSASECKIKLTPLEVKFRSENFASAQCQEALGQAAALSALFNKLQKLGSESDLVLWRLAFQHLLGSMLGFAFRVYSQQRLAANQSTQWTEIHARVIGALFAEEAQLEIDPVGRLMVLDKSTASAPRDVDGDMFHETLVLSPHDAASVLLAAEPDIYQLVKKRIGDWSLLPKASGVPLEQIPPTPVEPPAPAPISAPGLSPQGLVETPKSVESPASASPLAATGVEQAVAATPPNSVSETAEETSEGINFAVGETIDGFKKETLYFHPSDTNLNQLNIGVVGDLGTGKTQLLKALIYRTSKSAAANRNIQPRFLIFDYKKDYSDPEFVKAVGAKVVKPHRLPINVFDISNSKDSLTPWLDRFNFFSDVLDKIYPGIGPVQRKQLKTAVKQAYDACLPSGRQPTIYDVNSCYASIIGNKADSPSAILEDLVDREMFHPEPEKAESFEAFLNGVVVVDLASLGQDDRAKNMLVAVMLNMFYEHMLRIPKRPYVGSDPQLRAVDSFLLVDEADNIMRYEFDVLRKVLLQGREFGVGVILASQYLRHFKAGATDYREPLLTWFLHKVPNVTPNELQALGMTMDVAQLAERIKTLPKHCCLYKTLGVAGDVIQGIPFYKLLEPPH
jgi:DNA phosphorothioation-dependent restriction protein DptH